jgi:ribosomal protein S18 acetylase RimI-like enzyme
MGSSRKPGIWCRPGSARAAETEIVARGYETLHLRVVRSNATAIEFYRRHGWQIARTFPHEKFPITMLEMLKTRQHEK